MLRSLIRQLVSSTDNRKTREISMALGYKDEDDYHDAAPTLADCEQALLMTAALYPKTFLVLDGLETLEQDALQSCVGTLMFLLYSSTRPLKIFISSRFRHAARQLLQSTALAFHHVALPHWDADDLGELSTTDRSYAKTYYDIETFVRANLDNNLVRQVEAEILRKCEGVYVSLGYCPSRCCR